jgi:hypothetical protein
MSKVISFLNAHPTIVKTLPGISLFADSGVDDVKAVAALVLETEPETMAYEESQIELRFTMESDGEIDEPVCYLSVVRVSIEHGDIKVVDIPIADIHSMKADLTYACSVFQCYKGTLEKGYSFIDLVGRFSHWLTTKAVPPRTPRDL